MKVKLQNDRRGEDDKKYDAMWNKLVRDARLSHVQCALVARYARELLGLRMHEVESACDMAWLIALIESEKFGTDVKRGATRLPRVQQYAANVRNEAYGNGCVNANGVYDDYDGCGLEHLQLRLWNLGVKYDTKL